MSEAAGSHHVHKSEHTGYFSSTIKKGMAWTALAPGILIALGGVLILTKMTPLKHLNYTFKSLQFPVGASALGFGAVMSSVALYTLTKLYQKSHDASASSGAEKNNSKGPTIESIDDNSCPEPGAAPSTGSNKPIIISADVMSKINISKMELKGEEKQLELCHREVEGAPCNFYYCQDDEGYTILIPDIGDSKSISLNGTTIPHISKENHAQPKRSLSQEEFNKLYSALMEANISNLYEEGENDRREIDDE